MVRFKGKKLRSAQRRVARARRFTTPIGFSSKRARKQDLSRRAINPRRKGLGRGNTGDFSSATSRRRRRSASFVRNDEEFLFG